MTFTASSEKTRPFWPRGLSSFVDAAVASHARAVAVLVAICLFAFIPGFFQIPPVDRDEARFAQATKQMIERGDYIDIRFQNDVRYKKPVGIYWLQAAVVKTAKALGVPNAERKIYLFRIPSLIGAIGGVLLTYWAALAFTSRRAAVLAGIMMAASILLGVEARLAKTDAMLFLTIVAAMGAMGRIYLNQGPQRSATRETRWLWPTIFWTAVAGGMLLKGPLILMFVGLTIAVLILFDRSARWLLHLRPLLGILWTCLLVLPWFVAILMRAGGAFLADSVGEDMLAKVISAQESHGAPPGFYFVLFFVTFWPASLLAGLAAPSVWRDRREPRTRFLLAWLVPTWIAFELVITKLPHYVLPLYPAIAILIAARLEPNELSKRIWLERGMMWWFIAPAILGVACVVLSVTLSGELNVRSWPFIAAAFVFGLRAWWLYETDGAERATLRAAAASILLTIGVYSFVIPHLPSIFPSVQLAKILRDADCSDPVAATAGFHEPSLVFLAGTQTQLTDGLGAAEFLRRGGCRFAFIERSHERSFAQRADAIGLRYAPGPRIEGSNLSGGRQVSIGVFRSLEQP